MEHPDDDPGHSESSAIEMVERTRMLSDTDKALLTQSDRPSDEGWYPDPLAVPSSPVQRFFSVQLGQWTGRTRSPAAPTAPPAATNAGPGSHGTQQHTHLVTGAVLQTEIGADGTSRRLLILHVGRKTEPLMLIGPGTDPTSAPLALPVADEAMWDQLLDTVRAGTATATWSRDGGRLLGLVLSLAWEPGKQTTGKGGGLGFGLGIAVPLD